MQSQFQRVSDVNEALRRMRGLEFVIHSEAPPDLWIIAKQQRDGYDECEFRPLNHLYLTRTSTTSGHVFCSERQYLLGT